MNNKAYEDLLKDVEDIEGKLVAKIIADAYAGELTPCSETVMEWNGWVTFRLDSMFSLDSYHYTLVISKNVQLNTATAISINLGTNDAMRVRFKYVYQTDRKRKLNALWGRIGGK